MSIFDAPAYDGHELVTFGKDAVTGLRAIIAVHSTTLGPAVGGCRMYPYVSEEHALDDGSNTTNRVMAFPSGPRPTSMMPAAT